MGTIEDIKDFWVSKDQTTDILYKDRHLLLRKEADDYFTYLYADIKPSPRSLPTAHSHYAELNYYVGCLKRLIKPPLTVRGQLDEGRIIDLLTVLDEISRITNDEAVKAETRRILAARKASLQTARQEIKDGFLKVDDKVLREIIKEICPADKVACRKSIIQKGVACFVWATVESQKSRVADYYYWFVKEVYLVWMGADGHYKNLLLGQANSRSELKDWKKLPITDFLNIAADKAPPEYTADIDRLITFESI